MRADACELALHETAAVVCKEQLTCVDVVCAQLRLDVRTLFADWASCLFLPLLSRACALRVMDGFLAEDSKVRELCFVAWDERGGDTEIRKRRRLHAHTGIHEHTHMKVSPPPQHLG